MKMLHKRCDLALKVLQSELHEARTRIRELEQELNRRDKVAPVASIEEGSVYYMDDARMAELDDAT